MTTNFGADVAPDHEVATNATRLRPALMPGESARVVPSRSGLVVLGVVVTAGRLIYSAERTIFHLLPDELASLGVARWMSGTGSWNMYNADVWRPGGALLVAPIFWITDDQTTVYRLALALGTMIAGWSAVWLARILTRLTTLGPRPTLVIAGGVALMPAGLSASSFVWAEPLVTLSVLAALWHLMCHVELPSHRHALTAVTWASVGLVTHNRLMPLVPVVVGIVIVRSVFLRRWDQALSAACAAIACLAASQWLMSVVLDNVWVAPGSTNTIGATLGRLTDPLSVLDAAAGQIWYLLVASAMLFGIGVVVLVRMAGDRADPRRADAWLVLGTIGVLVATSIVFMSDRWRTDHLVYGRYNDAVVWPILGVGAAWLFEGLRFEPARSRIRMLVTPVAGSGALTLVLLALHGDQFERVPAFSTMIAGVQPAMSRTLLLDPARVAVISLLVFGILLLGAQLRQRGGLAVIAVAVLVVAGVATRRTVSPDINASRRSEVVATLSGDVIPVGSTVGYRITPDSEGPAIPTAYQWTYWYRYQWFLDDMSFAIDQGLGDGVGPFVFSTVNDRTLIEAGASQVWTDPYVPIALWRELEG